MEKKTPTQLARAKRLEMGIIRETLSQKTNNKQNKATTERNGKWSPQRKAKPRLTARIVA